MRCIHNNAVYTVQLQSRAWLQMQTHTYVPLRDFYHKLKGRVIMQCVVGSGDLFGGRLRMQWFAGQSQHSPATAGEKPTRLRTGDVHICKIANGQWQSTYIYAHSKQPMQTMYNTYTCAHSKWAMVYIHSQHTHMHIGIHQYAHAHLKQPMETCAHSMPCVSYAQQIPRKVWRYMESLLVNLQSCNVQTAIFLLHKSALIRVIHILEPFSLCTYVQFNKTDFHSIDHDFVNLVLYVLGGIIRAYTSNLDTNGTEESVYPYSQQTTTLVSHRAVQWSKYMNMLAFACQKCVM